MQGCDGSVLVNSTSNNQAEKEATPNLTLRGFDFIDRVKSLLEAECPGIVSCADTLALVARDSIVATVSILKKKNKPTLIFPFFYEQRNGLIIYLFYVMFCHREVLFGKFQLAEEMGQSPIPQKPWLTSHLQPATSPLSKHFLPTMVLI